MKVHSVPIHIQGASVVPGTGAKKIEEFVGRVNTGTEDVSIAKMSAPPAWHEPAQTPAFDEYTIVLAGELVVEYGEGLINMMTIRSGEALLCPAGVRVRYSTKIDGLGADYLAVCLPAFSPSNVGREAHNGA